MSDVPFPPEVLSQILSCLPVKSLLRFRSVSKPWRALIDSPYLIKLHINHSLHTRTNHNIIFGGDRTLCYIDLDFPTNSICKIDNPLYFAIFESVILGSCNGIVCLCTSEPDNEVAFWNPSIRKFRKIRVPPAAKCTKALGRGICIKGFGYDDANDDYKLIRLVQSCGIQNHDLVHSKLEVYSAKADAWRDVGDFPYHLCYRRNFNIFAGGALHWLVSRKTEPRVDFLIAAFDLTSEEHRLVPGPEFSTDTVQVNLAILGGCLSVVCNYPKKNVDVWVMKDYGVKESWVKLVSTVDSKILTDLNFVRPIVYSKGGQEVLLEKNFERLYWYDLGSKTTKRLRVAGMPRLFITDVFIRSLVQVDVGSAAVSDKNKEKSKEDDKRDRKRDDFLSKGFKLVL